MLKCQHLLAFTINSEIKKRPKEVNYSLLEILSYNWNGVKGVGIFCLLGIEICYCKCIILLIWYI